MNDISRQEESITRRNLLRIGLISAASIPAALFLSSCGSSSKKKDTTSEFAEKVMTPGTSENKWYNEKYLPEQRKKNGVPGY